MQTSINGLAIVKAFEGCMKSIGGGRYKPYYCPAGVLTVGWGHTNAHGRQFNPTALWTQAECDNELASDLKGFETAVDRRVKVALNQHQFDALVSFAYNCGEGNLAKSTLLKKVNAGAYASAALEFHKWNKGGGRVLPGLVRRRKAESLLFQGKAREAFQTAGLSRTEGPMPQQVDIPSVPSAPGTRIGTTAGVSVGGAVVAKEVHKSHGWGGVAVVIAIAILIGVLVFKFWPRNEG